MGKEKGLKTKLSVGVATLVGGELKQMAVA